MTTLARDHDDAEATGARILVPNLITAANICCGFVSIGLAADGQYVLAVWLLYVAIVFDVLDGLAARLLRATSEFGKQLDSFSDALSFGAAPAFLVWRANLQELGPAGLAVALAYLLAGVARLARYNQQSDAHQKSARTVGVPIPIGAGYLMAVALMRDHLSSATAAAVVLLLAFAMVTRCALPTLKGRDLLTGMLLVGITNYTLVMLWPNWWTVGWWNLWNVAIVLSAYLVPRRTPATTR